MTSVSDQAVISRFVRQLKIRYQALEAREKLAPVNRRRTRRRPCGIRLDISFPGHDQELEHSEFRTVRCRDLSSTGFSYWSNERPPANDLIVRFRLDDDEILVKTHVIHMTSPSNGAVGRFVIGCSFIERIGKQQPSAELESPSRL